MFDVYSRVFCVLIQLKTEEEGQRSLFWMKLLFDFLGWLGALMSMLIALIAILVRGCIGDNGEKVKKSRIIPLYLSVTI